MRDSRVIGVRIKLSTIEQIMRRANRRGWTFNHWMNWTIQQGIRPHVRKQDDGQEQQ